MKVITIILITVMLYSCNSQRIDLEKIELNTPISTHVETNDSLIKYYMDFQARGIRIENLNNYKFGTVELNDIPEYRISDEVVGESFTNYLYYIYFNKNGLDFIDSLSAIGISIKNTELSAKILDYLFKTYDEPENVGGNPLNKPDNNGIILDHIYYNWNINKNKSYFVIVSYAGDKGEGDVDWNQTIRLDMFIYDSSDKELKKALYNI